MKLKTCLYKCGKTIIVDAANEEELAALIAGGWADSPVDSLPEERQLPTHAQLEQKRAAEPGIKSSRRAKDKRLASLIEAATKE